MKEDAQHYMFVYACLSSYLWSVRQLHYNSVITLNI